MPDVSFHLFVVKMLVIVKTSVGYAAAAVWRHLAAELLQSCHVSLMLFYVAISITKLHFYAWVHLSS